MKHKVLIMRCNEYDPDRIAGIVKEGMEELFKVILELVKNRSEVNQWMQTKLTISLLSAPDSEVVSAH